MRRLWYKLKERAGLFALLAAQLYVVAFLIGACFAPPRWDLHILAGIAALAVVVRMLRETL